MAKIRFCNLCDRNIAARKKFNWTVFLLLCLSMVGGIFYIVWYIVKGGDACPICGNTNLLPASTKADIERVNRGEA